MNRLLPLLPALFVAACATPPPSCATPGQWISPSSLRTVPDPLPALARAKIVLLGEQHDSAADHRWQLATITRLYRANPDLVLGFEMFPRAAQPALDRWVDGQVSETEFLAQTDWQHVWGFPPDLYLPIFRFARDHHVPMLALNVSRRVVHLTAQNGWAALPLADREGVGTPAPPPATYRASLAEAMSSHGGSAMTPERLQHFIDAQSVWDRAMAEAIAAQSARNTRRQIVALTGAGHLENRNGIPNQLDALGLPDAVVLLPVHQPCAPMGRIYANAVFTD